MPTPSSAISLQGSASAKRVQRGSIAARATGRRALVLVQGDLGRSPRMQLHALYLARAGLCVDLVGHAGAPVLPELLAEPRIRVHARPAPRAHAAARAPVALARLAGRVLAEAATLGRALASLPRPQLLLVQTPPAIPALALASATASLGRVRLVIDWHNQGDALLALSLGRSHPVVRLHRWLEAGLANRAHAHLCVSEGLTKALERRGLAGAVTVPDAPLRLEPALLGTPRLEARSALLRRMGLPRAFAHRPWAVCPTSHGRDDALDLLLQVARNLPARSAEALVLVTGQGPGREAFERQTARVTSSRLWLKTTFLESADYRMLLRAADVGLCLHRSASGLDVPFKLAEMRGAGLATAALDYGSCLAEALAPGALRFANAEGLRDTLLRTLLAGAAGAAEIARVAGASRCAPTATFDEIWAARAAPVLGCGEPVYPAPRG